MSAIAQREPWGLRLTQHSSLLDGVGSVSDDDPVRGRTFTTQDLVGKLGDLEYNGRVQGFRRNVDDLIRRTLSDDESVNTAMKS